MNRKSTSWRKRAFARIAERDGLHCSSCGAGDRTIWRRGATSMGEFWGADPWERWQFCIVNPTSSLEVEHTVPLSEGGSNDDDNLRLMCMDCHKRKTSAERSRRLKKAFADWREVQSV